MAENVKRLYKEFQPNKYLLDLTIDKKNMSFSGSVIINGQKSGRPSQRITLHQKDLKVTTAHLMHHDKKGDTEIVLDRINSHAKFDELRLHAKSMLYPGNYTLRIEFNGKITRQMNGIYPCFFEVKGHPKQLIATQFESHHAREVFPCIDEPEAKAVFELALTHPSGEVALSNTPIAKQEKISVTNSDDSINNKNRNKKDHQVRTVFEPTPHMSTYLLAFIFGELEYKEAKTKDGVVVRTYATQENVKFTDFALKTAVKCLEFYNNYFGTDYPLAKCDLIALPDFASGAMENWGCITFREQSMLVDEHNTSLASKQYVAMVVAHELTHQWFGNLVTMRWWTDLWLNEGFASWMEYLAVDHMFPDWQIWTQFIVDEQQLALKLDALEHTHPIEVAVNHPDEIRTIFDTISYSKGASVIHMLHDYLGPEAFRDGLRHYLSAHQYSNTDTVDLWKSLEEISGKQVQSFMNAWTSQSGFPLMNATIDDSGVSLRQTRYFANPEHKVLPKQVWPIPLSAGNFLPTTLNLSSQKLQPLDVPNLKLNLNQSGFYRTTYNASHVQRLGEFISKGHLEPLDRLGILCDLFETARAGLSDTAEALQFLTHFKTETNYAVWDAIASAIASVRQVMNDEKLRDLMKPFILKLITPELKRLGWNRKQSDSHFDSLLRPIIISLAASADHETVVKKCLAMFDTVSIDYSKKTYKMSIDPDMRGIVFVTVARLGGQKEFDKLLDLHNFSSQSELRNSLLTALTSFKDPNIIRQSLEIIKSPAVRLQDVSYWIASSFMNRYAKDTTWDWLVKNWDWLEQNLGSDLSFYRMPIYVARAFSDRKFIAKYSKFFLTKMSPALERSYNQGLEILQIQSAWKTRALPEVKLFFTNN